MRVLHVVPGCPSEVLGGIQTDVTELLAAQLQRRDRPALSCGSFTPAPESRVERGRALGVERCRAHRAGGWFTHFAHARDDGVGDAFMAVLREEAIELVHVHHWLFATDDLCARAARCAVAAVLTLHDATTTCPRAYRVDRQGAPCLAPLDQHACARCVPRFAGQTDHEVAEAVAESVCAMRAELAAAAAVLAPSSALAALVAEQHTGPAPRVEVLPLPARELRAPAAGLPVHFRGRYRFEDLVAADLELAVFPSRAFESHGSLLDEAFALAIAAITTAVGAFAERGGAVVLRVPPADPTALAAALRALLADPARRDAIMRALPPPPPSTATHAAQLAELCRRACHRPVPAVPLRGAAPVGGQFHRYRNTAPA
ncbi:MAG: glycosyltransferase [Planctomycetes bacterium]|nr:glycosyltransferase [Planctomycetota bacterium]